MLIAAESRPTKPYVHSVKRADEHLEDLLINWVRWMESGGMSQFRVRCRSVGQGFKHFDTESAYIELDARLARSVDAIVSHDLKPLERDAINSEYLRAIWPHDISIHLVLVIARQAVREALARRNVWMGE